VTLFRQLTIAILTLFLVLYSGNLIVSLFNTRILVAQQMQVHAQDTASSLALSISQAAQVDDLAALETFFNAVSDSGFFQKLTYADLDGRIIVERHYPLVVESVPDWFMRLSAFRPAVATAEVTSNWSRIGKVSVTSHPGQAQQNLWGIMLQQLTWFAVVTVAVCLLGWIALRLLLQPLRRVELQANAICNQDFSVQEKLPRTKELRQVVETMNRMSEKLKQVFDNQLDMIGRLQLQSYRDAVTGISNRNDFDNRINSYVKDEKGPHSGALMIFAIADFAQINEVAGRAEGNNLLKAFANRCLDQIKHLEGAIAARRQGPEFSVFLPDITAEDAESIASGLFQHLLAIDWAHRDQYPLNLSMGFTFCEEIINGPELLSEADMALRQARVSGGSQWRKFSDLQSMDDVPLVSRPAMEWRSFIEEAIASGNTRLLFQDVFSVPYKSVLGREVFTRFIDGDNLLSAGIIIPQAERFDLATDLDKMVLKQLASTIDSNYAGYYAVNLCTGSIKSADFISWLDAFLKDRKDLAAKLVIEIPEYLLHVDQASTRRLQTLLGKQGAKLGIDHFGLEARAFGYLSSLPLYYLKVHRSFTRCLENNSDNQFYIKSLVQLAHSRDIKLIAEGVETEPEWQVLCQLGVDCCQGYYLAEPKAV